MTDREKAIKGLKCCAFGRDICDTCPYNNCIDCDMNKAAKVPMVVLRDVLTLLKAQEPRVITWRDVIGAAIECKPLFIEVKDSEDKEPGDDRWAMVTQYKDSVTNGMICAMSSYVTSEILFADDYGKSWRCWTSEPSEELRKKVKWNDEV